MKPWMWMSSVFWACEPSPPTEPGDDPSDEGDADTDADTDADSDADTDADADVEPGFAWDVPGEVPPITLSAVWVARLADEGDAPMGSAFWDANGQLFAQTVLGGEPFVAAVSVIAVSFDDPCEALAAREAAWGAANDRFEAGDTEGGIAALQESEQATPEDFWSLSAGTAAADPAQLATWDLFDRGTAARAAPSSYGSGAVFHHREDADYAAMFAGTVDPASNQDGWVLSGPLQMTAFDPAAGALEATATLALRRCPPFDPSVAYFVPCDYPSDGVPEGSVTFSFVATRCEALEDAITGFW